MRNLRKYGKHPFKVAVIHGGPGALGEMTPVARELSKAHGILEPLQTALTIEGEVEELRWALIESGSPPITLIGYSWGAWLSFILAERYPSLVSRLILVSSASFSQGYAHDTDRTRFERMNLSEREEAQELKAELNNPSYNGDKNVLMAKLGKLFSRADSFELLPHESEADCRWDIFSAIWPQATLLRRSGELLELGKDIKCPVVAIHGDYDPHPADGVRVLLFGVLKDFRLVLLKNCGHTPWFERQAKDNFYSILKKELG